MKGRTTDGRHASSTSDRHRRPLSARRRRGFFKHSSRRSTRGTRADSSSSSSLLAIAEQMGLPRRWIGYIFLMATVGLYAGIGIISRTSDAAEYYVAGRRVPAFFNGMATGADWMSAASFIGMAGTLYLDGLRRTRLRDGLDRRLLPGRAVPRAVPAQVRPVHDSRLPRRALRRPHPAGGRHLRRDPVLVHLRGGADLRRGPHHDAPDRRPVRVRRSSWAWAASWSARSWAACAR